MKPNREKGGQFIVIAVMLTAIMIISIGALMHETITYYKHEPWEEYATLIGDIEINSQRVVEFCLADYSNSRVADLNASLSQWQHDLTVIYPSSGIRLTSWGYSLTKGSNPTAKSEFSLRIDSIGLEGYKFSITASLNLEATLNSTIAPYTIAAVIKNENGEPVTGLTAGDFTINGAKTGFIVAPYYDEAKVLVYRIQFQGTPTEVKVTDRRGITAIDDTLTL